MFDLLKEWITGIVAMVLFVTIIDLLVPQNSGFKKYVSLVTGIIVVITILTPVFKLLDRRVDVQEAISQFTQDFDKKLYEIDEKGIEKSVNSQTIEVFKEKLKTNLESEIYKSTGERYKVLKLEIVEDTDSVNFASIKSLELKKSYGEGSVKPVDNITIGDSEAVEKEYRDERVASFLRENFNVDPSKIKFKK